MATKRTAQATGRLVSTTEIAQLIGFSRQWAHQMTKERGFPAPVDVLAHGAVWWRDEVEEYLRHRPRDRRRLEARIAEGRSKATPTR
jgi:predicted DNA-binding transcriptional regulator AlpA